MYLHFLTAAATWRPVMLMQRAILLAPEWMGSVLYQATSVRWDLQKHKRNEVLALTNCRNTNAHAVYQSAVQIIQVPEEALQTEGRRHILDDAAPCSTTCGMDLYPAR